MPPYCKVVSLDFEDHPFSQLRADQKCVLCGADESYLDEIIIDNAGSRAFICSDTDFCSSRQANGFAGAGLGEAVL